jgi:hypothetical protein
MRQEVVGVVLIEANNLPLASASGKRIPQRFGLTKPDYWRLDPSIFLAKARPILQILFH